MCADQQRQRRVCLVEAARVPRYRELLSTKCKDAALHRQESDLRISDRHEATATRCRRGKLFLREFHVAPPVNSVAQQKSDRSMGRSKRRTCGHDYGKVGGAPLCPGAAAAIRCRSSGSARNTGPKWPWAA